VQMAQAYSKRQIVEAGAWEQVSSSANFDQLYPVDLPADNA
jgi:hypothetical protein